MQVLQQSIYIILEFQSDKILGYCTVENQLEMSFLVLYMAYHSRWLTTFTSHPLLAGISDITKPKVMSIIV